MFNRKIQIFLEIIYIISILEKIKILYFQINKKMLKQDIKLIKLNLSFKNSNKQ